MRRPLLLGFLLLFACVSFALAAPLKFPKLTGRVVDEAHALSPGIRARLDDKLAGFEDASKNQVVVAILKSLQGDEIQDYGYQLGRAWGIGQKGKNNGVLLIVVPSEHKAGIEVGYGLEGELTDAETSQIINGIMLPEFSKGNIEQGIWKGADALLTALGATATAAAPPQAADSGGEMSNTEVIIILVLIVIFCIRYPTLAWFIFANLPSGTYRGGGSSRGGFSGGGGSFGGGGSSGSW